jgi:hypothetical protein
LVAFLIEQKADPNSRSLQRNTPLHFAAEAGHLHIVKDRGWGRKLVCKELDHPTWFCFWTVWEFEIK